MREGVRETGETLAQRLGPPLAPTPLGRVPLQGCRNRPRSLTPEVSALLGLAEVFRREPGLMMAPELSGGF